MKNRGPLKSASIMSGTEFKVGDIVATVVIVLSLVLAVGIAVLCRCHNKNKKKNKQIILNRDAAYIPVSKIMGSNCGVCLDSKDSRMGQVVKLHCNHTFHSECMAESLKRQTKCPLCRRRVKPFTPAQRIIAYIENKISQMRLTYNSEQVVESNV